MCAFALVLPAGSGRNSLHLALWGTLDTNSNTLEMTVGLPAETLSKAGLRGLPPGYMLPVAVSGPLHRPQVEWNAAGEAVAAKDVQLLLLVVATAAQLQAELNG